MRNAIFSAPVIKEILDISMRGDNIVFEVLRVVLFSVFCLFCFV